MSIPSYERPHVLVLAKRLREPRRFMQVVIGPRQVGKTTLVTQALRRLKTQSLLVSADEPTLQDSTWLQTQWERARVLAANGRNAVFVVDEVQKATGWAEATKRLWDEDTRAGTRLKVVLLGSAPLTLQQGITESLAGRFELLTAEHWSFAEMREAFEFSVDDYLRFGGYPGAAPLTDEPDRWRRYILDALVEPTIGRDVLLMTRVDKPALLRRLFELGCRYSGQVLSYTKMLGQLQDAGNTTTLAHYLDLLAAAGMLTGLQKYAGEAVRRRGSSPKLQVLNTALMTSQSEYSGSDPEFRGRLVESAVGAHLANGALSAEYQLTYWRDADRDVDFVVHAGRSLVAIEVKSGRTGRRTSGLAEFSARFHPTRTLLVGTGGIPLEAFLSTPTTDWLA